MSLQIQIDSVSREQWEGYAQKFYDYNIYQTWPYQQVRAEMDGQSLSRIIVADNDNPVLMCQMRIKNIKPLMLKIGYVQWGPLLRSKDNGNYAKEALQILRQTFIGKHVDVLRLVPNIRNDETNNQIKKLITESGFERVNHHKPYRTFIMKTDDSGEQIRSRLHKSFRRDLKTAENSGIGIQKGTGEDFSKILTDLYLASIKRKGFKGLNPEEFTKTQVLLSEQEKMNFYAATENGEPVAILLASELGDTSLVLLAAANEKGLSCGASYLVWYQGALSANKAGMKIYDLGGIDPDKNPNVYRFKSRLGGQEIYHIGTYEAYSNSVKKNLWKVIEKSYRILTGKGN